MNFDIRDLSASSPSAPSQSHWPPEATGAPPASAPAAKGGLDELLLEAIQLLVESAIDIEEAPPGSIAASSDGQPQDRVTSSAANRQVQQAVDGGAPSRRPHAPDFGQRLAALARQAEVPSHADAVALLDAAGVSNLRSAHLGSTADAALQSFLGQALKLPLRLAFKGVLMVPLDEGWERVAAGATAQVPRGVASVAVGQARGGLGNLAFFGRSLRPTELLSELRLGQEEQLARLVGDLKMLARQVPHAANATAAQQAAAAAPQASPGETVDLSTPAGREALAHALGNALIEHGLQAGGDANDADGGLTRQLAEVRRDNRTLKYVTGTAKSQARVRMAMAFAALTVDTLARTGAHAALGGTDLRLLAQCVSLATYPAMSALTQGVLNWSDTRAVAAALVWKYRQATLAPPPAGTSTAEVAMPQAGLQSLAHFAQDHFQTAAQARFHRRDERIFEPALQDQRRELSELAYEAGEARARLDATDGVHRMAIQAAQRTARKIQAIDLRFDLHDLQRDKGAIGLLLAYAQADADVLPPQALNALLPRHADAVLMATAVPDPEIHRLFDEFQQAYATKCGEPLSPARLKKLCDRAGRKTERMRDMLAWKRPADAPPQASFDRTRRLANTHGLWQERERLVLKLQRQRQEVQRLAAAAETAEPAAQEVSWATGEPPPAGLPFAGVPFTELSFDETRWMTQAATLEQSHAFEQSQTRDREQLARRDARQTQLAAQHEAQSLDVSHYRRGEASQIDPDGYVARSVQRGSYGLRAELKRRFAPTALRAALARRLGSGVALPTLTTLALEGGREGVQSAMGTGRPATSEASIAPALPADPEQVPGPSAVDDVQAQPATQIPPTAAPGLSRTRRAAPTQPTQPMPVPRAARTGFKPDDKAVPTRIGALSQDIGALARTFAEPDPSVIPADEITRANDLACPPRRQHGAWLADVQQAIQAAQARLAPLQAAYEQAKATLQANKPATDRAMAEVDKFQRGALHQGGDVSGQAQADAALGRVRAAWAPVAARARAYGQALRELAELQQRLRAPERSHLRQWALAAKLARGPGLPDATVKSLDLTRSENFDGLHARQLAELQPLAAFRSAMHRGDVTHAMIRVGQLALPAHQKVAIGMLLDRVDDGGRVTACRQLRVLPLGTQQPVVDALLRDIRTGPWRPALAAAVAALPLHPRQQAMGGLDDNQRRDVAQAPDAAPEHQPLGLAAETVAYLVASINGHPQAARGDRLTDWLDRIANGRYTFHLGRDPEAVTLLSRLVGSLPQERRQELTVSVIKAALPAAGPNGLAEWRRLLEPLLAIEGTDPGTVRRALVSAIGRVSDGEERCAAFNDAFGALIRRRPPASAEPAAPGAVTDATLPGRLNFDNDPEWPTFEAVLGAIPTLAPRHQLGKQRDMLNWISSLPRPTARLALPAWTTNVARLDLPVADRAELLDQAITRGQRMHVDQVNHLREAIIHRVVSATWFMDAIREPLARLGDAPHQAALFSRLMQFLDLHAGQRSLRSDAEVNELATENYFNSLRAVLRGMAPATQADGMRQMAYAVRKGNFDSAGVFEMSAATHRLKRFKALGDDVRRLPAPAPLEDAAHQLLAQAFPRTVLNMKYKGQPFERWEPVNRFERPVTGFLVGVPEGLPPSEEDRLLSHLFWLTHYETTGALLPRLLMDIDHRKNSQKGEDDWDWWIHGMQVAGGVAEKFAGRLGPKMPGRAYGRVQTSVVTPSRAPVSMAVSNEVVARIDAARHRLTQITNTANKQAKAGSTSTSTSTSTSASTSPGGGASSASKPGTAKTGTGASARTAAAPGTTADVGDGNGSALKATTSKASVDPDDRPGSAPRTGTSTVGAGAAARAPRKTITDYLQDFTNDHIQRGDVNLPMPVEQLRARAQTKLPEFVYRAHVGDIADIRRNGFKVAPPGNADEAVRKIFAHTSATVGSGGEVYSMTGTKGVATAHLRPGKVLVTIRTRDPNTGKPYPGFRRVEDLIYNDGVDQVDKGMPPGTLHCAVKNLRLDENEIFNVAGNIKPEWIVSAAPYEVPMGLHRAELPARGGQTVT